MEFRVLGPLELMCDEGALELGALKQRAVLAVLLLRANEIVSTDSVIHALWGDAVPRSAVGVVRTYVSRLRRVLSRADGTKLATRPPGYVLEIDPGQVDARRFENLVGEARRARDAGHGDVAAATLSRALGLWRGDVLADLADLDVFRPTVARLDLMRIAAIEDYIDARLALGQHAEVVAELESLTTQHPFRERLWSQLIVARYRLGRQTDALDAYRVLRSTLINEAGLDPAPELQSLERQVLDHSEELRWHPPPGTDAVVGAGVGGGGNGERLERAPGVLPAPLTRFFGREAELTELLGLVDRSRLVTLVGAPGSGKTRLAIELGAQPGPALPGGVWFTELAPITDPRSVAHAVGATLGVPEEPGRSATDALVGALGSTEPCLVLLDNCEHVAEAVGELAHRLIVGCPSLRVLATSRAALGVPGELVWNVPPLDLGSAVQLFADRATLASNGFHLDAANPATVEGICDRLDRLPLAIELAAAWTRVLSPDQIAGRLTRSLPLLTSGGGGLSLRHDTMAATVDRSYQLLPPVAQRMFTRLSVFAAGFDLEAAGALSEPDDEDVLEGLAALVNQSLVVADTATAGPMRYRLLEPVRQCGEALLAAGVEDSAVRRRHADHYLALAHRFDPWGLRGVEHTVPAQRLEQEEGNLLAALHWAADHPSDLGLELCVALATFWELSGRVNHGRGWMERLLAAGTPDERLRANSLAWAGRLAWRQGDYEGARHWLDKSLAAMGYIVDPSGEALARRTLATVAFSEGRAEQAVQLCRDSLALCEATDDRIGVIWSLQTLGWAHYVDGDVPSGDREMRAALAANRTIGNPTVTAHVLLGLQYGAFLAGDSGAQRAHLVGALQATRDAGGFLDESDWLWCGAVLAATEGRFDATLRVVGGARARNRRHGSQHPERIAASLRAALERVRDELGQTLTDRLVAEGEHLSWDDLVQQAIADPGDGGGT